eukprot:gene10749-45290_t
MGGAVGRGGGRASGGMPPNGAVPRVARPAPAKEQDAQHGRVKAQVPAQAKQQQLKMTNTICGGAV